MTHHTWADDIEATPGTSKHGREGMSADSLSDDEGQGDLRRGAGSQALEPYRPPPRGAPGSRARPQPSGDDSPSENGKQDKGGASGRASGST